MSFDNNSGDKSINYQRLEKLAEEIRYSYVRDCDKTQEMKEALEMLKDINSKSSLEEYFENNEKR